MLLPGLGTLHQGHALLFQPQKEKGSRLDAPRVSSALALPFGLFPQHLQQLLDQLKIFKTWRPPGSQAPPKGTEPSWASLPSLATERPTRTTFASLLLLDCSLLSMPVTEGAFAIGSQTGPSARRASASATI